MLQYVTMPATRRVIEPKIEDLWFGDNDISSHVYGDGTNTVTRVTDHRLNVVSEYRLSILLQQFNEKYKNLFLVDRHSLYRTFYVPKSSGGLRRIDAPNEELMTALNELKYIFETAFGAKHLYHTSAFAYIHGRSTISCVKKHQNNTSKWFGKFDVHNFFGSITPEWTLKMMSVIYPFSQLMTNVGGHENLEKALSLCFLDGVLPQGTPISPLITNILMIPIDYHLESRCRASHLVYSRYADDFLISSRNAFKFRDVEAMIIEIFSQFEAPFSLNTRKTRYGSANGSNWNFGIMLNKDNKMTIGRAKKKQFESMLTAYAKDKKNGLSWNIEDVRHLDGLRSYYKMIEGETIDRIIQHISNKHGVCIPDAVRADLRG